MCFPGTHRSLRGDWTPTLDTPRLHIRTEDRENPMYDLGVQRPLSRHRWVGAGRRSVLFWTFSCRIRVGSRGRRVSRRKRERHINCHYETTDDCILKWKGPTSSLPSHRGGKDLVKELKGKEKLHCL